MQNQITQARLKELKLLPLIAGAADRIAAVDPRTIAAGDSNSGLVLIPQPATRSTRSSRNFSPAPCLTSSAASRR